MHIPFFFPAWCYSTGTTTERDLAFYTVAVMNQKLRSRTSKKEKEKLMTSILVVAQCRRLAIQAVPVAASSKNTAMPASLSPTWKPTKTFWFLH
jgi:hypothetical protein